MEPEDMDSYDWDQVAQEISGRDGSHCKAQWQHMHFQKGSKVKWTPLEDQILRELIVAEGPEKWASLAR
jgi:hypothetical protein